MIKTLICFIILGLIMWGRKNDTNEKDNNNTRRDSDAVRL